MKSPAPRRKKKPSRKAQVLALAATMREHVQRQMSPDIYVLPWEKAAEVTRRPFRIVARWCLKQIKVASHTKTVVIGDPKDLTKIRSLHEELAKIRPAVAKVEALRSLLAQALPYVMVGKKGKMRKRLEAAMREILTETKPV